MHGQVLSPIPLSRAIESIFEKVGKIPVIYMSPSGQKLHQELCESLSCKLDEYIIICGHYE
jgi:tRNA (guanine-N1)-methyltransferase